MPTWLILILVVVALIAGVVVLGIILIVRNQRKLDEVLTHGEHVQGWVVMANNALYKRSDLDDAHPALLLIARDSKVGADEKYMSDLVERVLEITQSDPDDLETDDEHDIRDYVTSERYVEGSKLKIPKSITNGPAVYLCHVLVFRKDLPRRRLAGPTVACAIRWDQPGSLICSRPVRASRRHRNRDDADDEDE